MEKMLAEAEKFNPGGLCLPRTSWYKLNKINWTVVKHERVETKWNTLEDNTGGCDTTKNVLKHNAKENI